MGDDLRNGPIKTGVLKPCRNLAIPRGQAYYYLAICIILDQQKWWACERGHHVGFSVAHHPITTYRNQAWFGVDHRQTNLRPVFRFLFLRGLRWGTIRPILGKGNIWNSIHPVNSHRCGLLVPWTPDTHILCDPIAAISGVWVADSIHVASGHPNCHFHVTYHLVPPCRLLVYNIYMYIFCIF